MKFELIEFEDIRYVFSGLYAGIYLTQNYNVPTVPDPTTIPDKLKKILEETKKDK